MVHTIAVDFDKVIHTYERGWDDGSIYGEFQEGAIKALRSLMDIYAVYIHSTRNPRQVARWIERKSEHQFTCTTKVPRSGFWNQQGVLLCTPLKLPAYAYIDDRGIRWRSWSQALTALARIRLQDKAGKDGIK